MRECIFAEKECNFFENMMFSIPKIDLQSKLLAHLRMADDIEKRGLNDKKIAKQSYQKLNKKLS